MTDLIRIHAVVTGSVQGVGFRFLARDEATRRALAGYVRNLPDGTVEVEAEGASASVEEFVDWLRIGPDGADVTGAEISPVDPSGASGFEVRH